jgi:hypothetical protein
VVDKIRTKEYNVFKRINSARATINNEKGVYTKLDEEISKIKENMQKANEAKKMFNDLFADV